MKKIMLPVAIMSLILVSPAISLGQSKARTRQTPKVGKGGQICTGCCDPCYNDDVAKVRDNTTPNTTNPNARKRNTRRAK